MLSDFLTALVSILCILGAVIIIGVLTVLSCWIYRICREKCWPLEYQYTDQYEQMIGDNPPSYNAAHKTQVNGQRAEKIAIDEEEHQT